MSRPRTVLVRLTPDEVAAIAQAAAHARQAAEVEPNAWRKTALDLDEILVKTRTPQEPDR